MRTTVNIAPDLLERLRGLASERRTTLSAVVNDALRRGMDGEAVARPYRVAPRRLGLRPGIDLTKATALAASLEDDAIVDKLELRK